MAAEAQADVSAQDRAAARSMSDSARELVKSGNYAAACPKFEESQRLDPGSGTQFNLADCYEHIGRTASAWSVFLEAATHSKLAGQSDREKASRERADALAPRLVRLSIAVPPGSQADGLEVRRDGTVVGAPMWGQGVPVDPGAHAVEASAPGRVTWKTNVDVREEGKTLTLTVPPLEKAATVVPASTASAAAVAPVPAPSPAPAQESKPFVSRKTVGAVVAGVGFVGLGIATVFAMQSKSKLNDAKAYCNDNTCWDRRGVDLHSEAVSAADFATIFSIVGGVALVSGVVVYLTAPPSNTPARTERPRLVAGPGSLMLQGSW